MIQPQLKLANTPTVEKVHGRPSSPRQFFERLYGHLECSGSKTVTAKTKHVNNNTSVLPSNCESVLTNGKICSTKIMLCANDTFPNKILKNQFNQKLYGLDETNVKNKNCTSLPTFTSNNVSLRFSSDQQFSTGWTAFLPRKRRKVERQRRQRTTFNCEQTLQLEVEFHQNEYISRSRRLELAENLRLTDTQIKIWFQNRRAKDKRIEKAQIDQCYRNFVVSSGFLNSFFGQPNYQQSVKKNLQPATLHQPLSNVHLPLHVLTKIF